MPESGCNVDMINWNSKKSERDPLPRRPSVKLFHTIAPTIVAPHNFIIFPNYSGDHTAPLSWKHFTLVDSSFTFRLAPGGAENTRCKHAPRTAISQRKLLQNFQMELLTPTVSDVKISCCCWFSARNLSGEHTTPTPLDFIFELIMKQFSVSQCLMHHSSLFVAVTAVFVQSLWQTHTSRPTVTSDFFTALVGPCQCVCHYVVSCLRFLQCHGQRYVGLVVGVVPGYSLACRDSGRAGRSLSENFDNVSHVSDALPLGLAPPSARLARGRGVLGEPSSNAS